MSYRWKGVQHIQQMFSQNNTLMSQLLFEPLQVPLSTPSDEKIDMIAEKEFFAQIWNFKDS